MNKDDFEKHLHELAEMVIFQQGLHFSSHQDAQRQLEQMMDRLRSLLGQSNAMFVEGLGYLSQRHEAPASVVARKIQAQLAVPDEVAKIIEDEIIQNPHALKLFSEAVNSFYDCGDFHVEECVIAVLLTLFPMEPQPFACYATLLWRKHGIGEAVSFYKKIVDLFDNPVLDYFAADCYFKAGEISAAKKLIDRAMINAQQSPGLYDDIGQFIRNLLRQF